MITLIRDYMLVIGSTLLLVGLVAYGITRGISNSIWDFLVALGEARYKAVRQRGFKTYY